MECIQITKYNFQLFDFCKFSKKKEKKRKYFGIVGVFVKQIVILKVGFGFCVFKSIWKHRLKIFFDPQNRKNSTPEN